MADSIALNIYELSFAALGDFAQKIHDGFLAHTAEYPSPKPPMNTFKGHIDDLNKYVVKWGIKGNRGKHADYTKLLGYVKFVRRDLVLLAGYAESEQTDMPLLWLAIGFPLEKQREKNQKLAPVTNLKHVISRGGPAHYNHLMWKKPLETKSNLVKGYIIQTNDTPEYPADPNRRLLLKVVGVVTKTSFTDMKPLPGQNWYWVIPFNSQGLGVVSNPIMVFSVQIGKLSEE